MPKFYCVSDIHSFYNQFIAALNKSGFDKNNPDHWLIVCGDCFDRGPGTMEVMNYLQSLERKILVKGNHEELMLDCVNRGYPERYDMANGTWRSVLDLAPDAMTQAEACKTTKKKIVPFVNQMKDYFETKNFIFVHSWIAITCKDSLPDYYIENRKFEFNPDWRNASERDWKRARWGNPYKLARKGDLLPDKTIVFGHFNTSYPRAVYENGREYGPTADFSIYYGDKYIGLDGCTAYSGIVNVLVLEDEFLEI